MPGVGAWGEDDPAVPRRGLRRRGARDRDRRRVDAERRRGARRRRTPRRPRRPQPELGPWLDGRRRAGHRVPRRGRVGPRGARPQTVRFRYWPRPLGVGPRALRRDRRVGRALAPAAAEGAIVKRALLALLASRLVAWSVVLDRAARVGPGHGRRDPGAPAAARRRPTARPIASRRAKGDLVVSPLEHASILFGWDGNGHLRRPLVARRRRREAPDGRRRLRDRGPVRPPRRGRGGAAHAAGDDCRRARRRWPRRRTSTSSCGTATRATCTASSRRRCRCTASSAAPRPGLLYHQRGRGDGYVLDFGGTRVYVSGDTECTPEMHGARAHRRGVRRGEPPVGDERRRGCALRRGLPAARRLSVPRLAGRPLGPGARALRTRRRPPRARLLPARREVADRRAPPLRRRPVRHLPRPPRRGEGARSRSASPTRASIRMREQVRAWQSPFPPWW